MSNCSLLITFIIPNDDLISRILPSFSLLPKIKTIKLPSSIETIPAHTFAQSEQLQNINLSELTNLLEINDCAFSFCRSLSSIDFPSNLKSIGQAAFYQNSLVNVTFPKSLTHLGKEAFSWEHSSAESFSLISIDLSKCDHLKKIEDKCFEHSLSSNCSVIFNDNLESIGASVFTNGEGADQKFGLDINLAIPKNVSFVGEFNITRPSPHEYGKWYFSVDKPNSNVWCLYLELNETSGGTHGPANFREMNNKTYGIAEKACQTAYMWGGNISGKVTFPDNLVYINASAFERQWDVTAYENIPKSLKNIGANAFINNSIITNFSIPEDSNLEYIGDGAFWYDKALTKFDFNKAKNLSYIGVSAFCSCAGIQGINLADNQNLFKIEDSCFASVLNLKTLSLPYTLANIGPNAFLDDKYVDNVYFSYVSNQFTDPYFKVFGIENLPKIESEAHIYIPNGMTKQDYLKAFPDLPEEYSYDSTIWENWNAPTPIVDNNTTISLDKLLIIIFGCVAGVMLIIIICLAAALSKKKKLLNGNPKFRKGNDPRRKPPMPPRRPRPY